MELILLAKCLPTDTFIITVLEFHATFFNAKRSFLQRRFHPSPPPFMDAQNRLGKIRERSAAMRRKKEGEGGKKWGE